MLRMAIYEIVRDESSLVVALTVVKVIHFQTICNRDGLLKTNHLRIKIIYASKSVRKIEKEIREGEIDRNELKKAVFTEQLKRKKDVCKKEKHTPCRREPALILSIQRERMSLFLVLRSL